MTARLDITDYPLHDAARRDDIDALRISILNGCSVDEPEGFGFTALHIAAASGNEKAAIFLLENNASVSRRDSRGDTPLHRAAKFCNRLAVIEALIDHGADVNALTLHSETPLHAAAEYGNSAAARILLDRGADPTLRDSRNNTPAFLANFELKLLLEKAAERNARVGSRLP